jgi:hypothetical protein
MEAGSLGGIMSLFGFFIKAIVSSDQKQKIVPALQIVNEGLERRKSEEPAIDNWQ